MSTLELPVVFVRAYTAHLSSILLPYFREESTVDTLARAREGDLVSWLAEVLVQYNKYGALFLSILPVGRALLLVPHLSRRVVEV